MRSAPGQDIDFALAQITVRDAKGGKDRVTMLPLNLSEPLRRHLVRVKAQHDQDLEDGFGSVHLPFALARKSPNAARQWRGNMFFLLLVFRSIRAPAGNSGTMLPKEYCKAR
jgi:hypothetical protein